jgi:ribosomal protein L17
MDDDEMIIMVIMMKMKVMSKVIEKMITKTKAKTTSSSTTIVTFLPVVEVSTFSAKAATKLRTSVLSLLSFCNP